MLISEMTEATQTPETIKVDSGLDVVDAILTPTAVKRRNGAMLRTHSAGLPACEACGKGIHGDPALVLDDQDTGSRMPLGPTCAKKVKRLLAGK